jgi:hypothetical protein
MCGCKIGTKRPILRAKWDEVYPVNFSKELSAGTVGMLSRALKIGT